MMKKRFGSKKLKGTVLYTVISVLMVLIVFLMGTLALAATASNRAMNNYSSAQTQYTAKAAVEAIMSAMQNNVEIATAANKVSETNPKLTVDGVTFSDASLGTVESAVIEYAGTKWVLEDDSTSDDFNKMVAKTIVKISATVRQGNETSTVAAYVQKDTNPSVNNDGDNRGFVSTGSATAGNHVSLYGGAYFGFDQLYANPAVPLGTDNYFLQDANKAIETDFQVNGNLTNDSGDLNLVIKNVGTGMTIWGNLTLVKPLKIMTVNALKDKYTEDAKISYTKIPYIYVEKTFGIGADGFNLGSEDIPLNIYCGDIDLTKITYINKDGNTQEVSPNGTTNIYADVYCYDAAAVSTFSSGSSRSNLYKWAANVVNPAGNNDKVESGNFYSKGSLEVNSYGATFNGDVKVEGNVTVNTGTAGGYGMTVDGDLWVGGTLTVTNSNFNVKGTIYCDNIVGYSGANTSPLRPGVETVVPGYYTLKTGYTSTILNAEYDNGKWGWIDHLGNVIQHCGVVVIDVRDAAGNITGKRYYKDWYGSETQNGGEIFPPTYTAYFDAAGQPVSEAEAADAWIPPQYLDAAGQPVSVPVIFPAEYEKEVILGNETLPGETDVKKSKIITTVSEVLNSSTSPYITLHEVPSEYRTNSLGTGTDDTVINIGTDRAGKSGVWSYKTGGGASDHTYEINGSCTLKGGLSTGSSGITIKVPTNQEIWIVIDPAGLSMSGGATMLVDDTDPNYKGTVNFLLKGDLKFYGNKAYESLITKSVVEKLESAGKSYQIYTDSSLKLDGVEEIGGVAINIYDDGYNHELYYQNSSVLSANIKAPYLNMRYESGGGVEPKCTLYYNGMNVKDAKSTQLGCIGCCIVNQFYSQNNWMMLYVGKTGGGGDDGFDDALMKNWKILYYENY